MSMVKRMWGTPLYERWRAAGAGAYWYDTPVAQLTTDELHALIGYLMDSKEQMRADYQGDMKLLTERKR